MTKKVIEKIKSLCTGEIEFCGEENNSVWVLVPYDVEEKTISIEGKTINEQVESFISGINNILDSMIDSINDCKLSSGE